MNTSSERNSYSLLVAFWGDFFIDCFLNYCIPSLNYSKNLPYLCSIANCGVKIATREREAELLKQSELFGDFCKRYEVDLQVFPDSITDKTEIADKKYSVWSIMLNRLKERAYNEGRNFIYGHPDSIYPNGFFRTLNDNVNEGKELIYTVGLRVEKEATDFYFESGDISIEKLEQLDQYHFDKYAISCVHEFVKRQYWLSERFSSWPSALLFELDRSHVVGRFFDMHPIYVGQEVGQRDIQQNIDVVYDSEVLAELSRQGKLNSASVMKGDARYFASLTEKNDPWTKRLYLVADDSLAPLSRHRFPKNDKEKFFHIQRWVTRYAPLKKILCFQDPFIFKLHCEKLSKQGEQRFHDFNDLCEVLIEYRMLHLDRLTNLPIKIHSSSLGIDIV